MPRYNCVCLKCQKKKEEEIGRELTEQEIYSFCLFETYHTINPSDKELKESMICPECNSTRTKKSFIGLDQTILIRGVSWIEYKNDPANKAAMDREMQLHTLRNNDPYKSMRQDGEQEHLESTLENKKKPKKNRMYFT